MPGRAQGVALYLDRMKDNYIIGTVAGDDSIIVVPDSHKNVDRLVALIRKIAQE
jgi:transcriptional regulator of arginine metabolism